MESERVALIEVSPEERQEIEARAHERGFDTLEAYVRALIEADEFEDEDDIDPAEALREAMRDIKAGRVYPVETLWEDLDDVD
jgi:hypothetical protein